MKHYSLLLLSCLLMTSHVFAQNNLSLSGHRWPQPVEKLLRQIETTGTPVSHGGLQQRNVLRLDSTKNFILYDQPTTGDSTPAARTIYQYPQPNVEVQLAATFENGVWMPASRTTITNDNLDRLLRYESENFNPITQDYQLTLLLESFPHGNALLQLIDSFFVSQVNPATMVLERVVAFYDFYDAQDRLLEERSTITYPGLFIQTKDIYSYDAQGDNYLTESFDVAGSNETATSRTDRIFSNHVVTEEINSAYVGADLVPQLRYTYTYTSFDALQQSQTFQWDIDSSTWMLVQTTTYTYDAQQRKIQEISDVIAIDSEIRTRVDYTYIMDEFLSSEVDYDWDFVSHTWILQDKTYYYYNDVSSTKAPVNHNLILSMLPNPTAGLIRLQLDNAAMVQLCNASGQVLQNHLLQPGQTLDLTTLPAGIYQVVAHVGNAVYSGQVIKR